MKDTLLDNLHMADINPRICGVEACAPGHSFGPAVREYFLLHYFSRIAGCGDMPAKEWRICAQLYELFAELDAARGPAQGHGGNYVGQAVNYIESNYSQPMRVQDIAAGLGLNRSYFCRLFRQQTGLSPQEYIVSCRLAKAAQFMTEHGMSQEEAARQAGYPDVFSFSRMFRRKYGMPPGRYAARARQKQGG